MKKKKSIEIKQQTPFTYIFDKQTIFTQRKKVLISRDPLTKELLKKLDEYRPNKSKPSEKEIESIRQDLEDKWNVGIIITAAAKPFVTGLPVIKNQTKSDCLSPIKFSYDGKTIQELAPLIITNRITGNPVESFYSPVSGLFSESILGTLDLRINLNLLNRHDGPKMKEIVWSIIEKHLPRKNPKEKIIDVQELSFIYSINKETFDNYIRWYDWHYNRLLKFREIAFIDNEHDKGKTDVNDLIDQLKKKRFPIGTKKSYRGEDAVEHGVKIIYKAIHQKKYPAKKDRHETFLNSFDCPAHQNSSCPSSCKHFQQWNARFNNAMPAIKDYFYNNNIDRGYAPEDDWIESIDLKLIHRPIKKVI